MTGHIKITVLIPCYNAGKYIRAAINSIINQSYQNLEILILDDGSVDNSREIIKEYSAIDPRIVAVYNESNMGLIRTLNKGVQLATGTFIARMDADDISDLNRIETLFNGFRQNPDIDVISAGYYYLSVKGHILRRAFPKATMSKALHFVSFFCTPVNHPCVMVKADVFKSNAFNENFLHSEDYELFSRLLEEGYHFMNLNKPLYYLRVNPESVSHRFEQIQISTHMRISVATIENYFDKRFEFFLHKVMVNRIGFDVSFQLLKTAMTTLDQLREDFIRKERADPMEIREIDEFLNEQKIDIYLQTLKYAKWHRKPLVMLYILLNLDIFFTKRGLTYMRLKFNHPFADIHS